METIIKIIDLGWGPHNKEERENFLRLVDTLPGWECSGADKYPDWILELPESDEPLYQEFRKQGIIKQYLDDDELEDIERRKVP